MIRTTRVLMAGLLALACFIGYRNVSAAEWQISTEDGKSHVKFGFLSQLQLESIDTPDAKATSTNLFLRRMRFIMGGKINEKITFFIDTDCPNLGKSDDAGVKNQADIFLQDVVVTYKFADEIMIDGGLIIIPVSYNSTQSAAGLLAVDFSPYSFLSSGPTTSRTGRDYGVQARGYVAEKHIEYRVGVFQGSRGKNAAMPLRYAGRFVWYPFNPQTGLFYTGTTLGQKKIVGLGASIDKQKDYQSTSLDLYVDYPLGGSGNSVTFQTDWLRYDGGDTFVQLPRQNTYLVEAGFYVKKLQLTPYIQYSGQRFMETGPSEDRYQFGACWWPKGHSFNLKFGVAQIQKDGAPDRTQVLAQCQVYQF